MAKKTKKPSPGTTTPKQFRLQADTLGQLDRIAEHYGLSTRSEAIRFLAKAEAKKIDRKSSESD